MAGNGFLNYIKGSYDNFRDVHRIMPYYSSRREALKIIDKAAGFTFAVMACPALLGEVLADDGCEIERKVNSIVNYLGTRIRENKDYSNAHKLIDGYVNESTMQV